MDFATDIPSHSVLGYLLRLPLKLVPSARPVRVLSGALRGKRWYPKSSHHGCWLGTYEQSKQLLFASLVQRGDVVYDLGANAGFYSLLAATLTGESGLVYSFEPFPRNILHLRMNLEVNGLTNFKIFEAAVGRSSGLAVFNPGRHHCTGSIGEPGEQSIEVPIIALDTLVAEDRIAAPNLIKCDIEGGEFDALQGAQAILRESRPTVLLATHGAEVHRKCCDLLSGMGYALQAIDGLPVDQCAELLAVHPSRGRG
jgi:FkbM family methyltransferase